ncbi:DNA gyrase subunit A [Candidatus Kaiserbacteria bacterium RIFCSPHIGHO2_01_FULL_49_13]|uniref:DNA gyrase subunit A n=1 Tax=Candidatus Kaiserbacteria bacterium RIFCSPHIGHO2_01_FULL_49_13 TaxID=1798477 RepID=A0A1F6CDJ9_9BACT|nr:MAG: DNA gyrase subunit A [Candidatus Kaiserbacteria bacterium RIFCSPHIGHO2_01_FULL_49_13]
MAKKDEKQPIPSPINVIPRSISQEMRESYLDYAMSVITARALPDVRDGLKPVHRRILYTMHQMGLTSSAKFRKSAAVIGDVMGKYHPHGDAAIYEAMVKMAQDFTYRYPLVIGQGNFGSIDGDNAAAMRYTEAKMSPLAGELLRDLEKETVPWRSNYDGTKKEPSVLPAAVPNLLLNGTLGIAVGMATNIAPHNLKEVVDATVHLIDHKEAATEDLMQFVKGPDFPTGGIAFNQKDIQHAYASGKGGVVVRGEAEIGEDSKGNYQIVITSIPYRVNKSDLITRIADLVREKKLEGIKDLRDESARDIRVVVDLKNGAQPKQVLNYLYKHTQLEDTFHFNMVALVDGVPQTLSLKGMLEAFIGHRQVIVRRRADFDLRKAEDHEHILLGLSKALDHIEKVIKTIRAAKDVTTAHAALMKEFKFSDRQATAILEMRLQKLAGLERKKIEDDLKATQALIKSLKELLSTPKNILKAVKSELVEIGNKYADPRRTKIMKQGITSLSMEDIIVDEESVLVLTAGGYVKRTDPGEFRKQKRGGVGVVDLNTKEEDFVTNFLTTSSHSDILFFTDKGKTYQIKMYDLPEGKRATKGKSIVNYLALGPNEKVTSVLAMPKESKKTAALSLLMITKQGLAKKTEAENFHDVRRSGLIAIKLKAGDELISASFVEKGDEAVVVTSKGQSIRFKESDIRPMGRTAAGVRAMRLRKGDVIVSADVVQKASVADSELLVISKMGYGKRTKLTEYKVQKRGGSGIKTMNITAKTGELIGARVVSGDEGEVVVMSKKGQVIKVDLKEISSLSRATQGVRVMKLYEGDGIATLVCL